MDRVFREVTATYRQAVHLTHQQRVTRMCVPSRHNAAGVFQRAPSRDARVPHLLPIPLSPTLPFLFW